MDFIPNALWLVRGHSRSSPEVGGVAASSAVAFLEQRLVATSFRSVQAASSTEVAARHSPPGQPRRIESSGTKSGREVTERVGCSGRNRVGSGTSGSVEGSRTVSQRTSPRDPSRGVSGIHQTLAEPHCSLGGGTSARTAGAGRRVGSHGQVSRRDGQVNSCGPNRARSHTASQDPGVGLGGRAVAVTRRRDGDGTGGGTEEAFQIIVSSISRPRWKPRSGVASTARPAHRTAQRGDHGDPHQSREHVGSEFQPVQPIGLSPARRVVAWGARGVRVGEAQNPGSDDTLERTQVDGGAHSTEESGAAGTVRQESDTESVASVNEATVPAPRVGSRRRRLVLVGANPPPNHVAEEVDLTVADSPSESGDSSAAVAEEVVHDQIPQNSLRNFELTRRALTAGLECLDQVELHNVFRTRALVMKNVPFMMKGVFRVALTTAMGEVLRGHDDGDELRKERGWKMLMLLPRMLLARPRGGRISQRKLQTRIDMFTTGQWHLLMEVSNECARAGVEAKVRASRRSGREDTKSRVRRAETLVHLGELSAGRQALDGAEVAPIWPHWRSSPILKGGHQFHVTFCQAAQPQFLRGLSSWIQSCSARMSVQHVVGPHRVRLACQLNTSWDWSSPTTIWTSFAVLPQSSAKGTCQEAFWKGSE